MPKLFLSYASEDRDAVRELARRLRSSGLEIWLDVDEIGPGDAFLEKIQNGLATVDAFALYVGPSGIAKWRTGETRLAVARNANDPTFRLIPILAPGSSEDLLPDWLKQFHWVDLRESGIDDAGKLQQIADVLQREPKRVQILKPGELPFRGLRAFQPKHSHLFYGRERETSELVQCLEKDRFLIVVGNSGCGKSSLVRAGLIPELEKGVPAGELADSKWRWAITRPGDAPLKNLASDLATYLEESKAERGKLEEVISSRLGGANDSLEFLLDPGERLLLVVDQLEELFTLTRTPETRDRYLDLLRQATERKTERPVHVVATLRSDFFGIAQDHGLNDQLKANQYPVARMSDESLHTAIQAPLRLAGSDIEPSLLAALVSDLGREPGRLALLEHALFQLWTTRGTSPHLTLQRYKSLGQLGGALAAHAEKTHNKLPDTGQDLARKLFLRLIKPGRDQNQDTRRRATKDELSSLADTPEALEAVLEPLLQARLLTSTKTEIEIAHEALITAWPRLDEWLEEDRDLVLLHDQLETAATIWHESGRTGSTWSGTKLEQAITLRSSGRLVPTKLEEEFLAASERADEEAEVVRRADRAQAMIADVEDATIALRSAMQQLLERRDAEAIAACAAWLEDHAQLALRLDALRCEAGFLEPHGKTWLSSQLTRAADSLGELDDGAVLAHQGVLDRPRSLTQRLLGGLSNPEKGWDELQEWMEQEERFRGLALDRLPGFIPMGTDRLPELALRLDDDDLTPKEDLAWLSRVIPFVLIPPGVFLMGQGRKAKETRIEQAFLLAKFPMTQGQWQTITGHNPSHFAGEGSARRPVEQVSWDEVRPSLASLGLRLPDEAEWEYACRAGSTGTYCFGEDFSGVLNDSYNAYALEHYAWFAKNADVHTHDVGMLRANDFGLCDMHGNVWEWCEDTYDARAPYRVIRGGGWYNPAEGCRSANRLRYEPERLNWNLGFRPARSYP